MKRYSTPALSALGTVAGLTQVSGSPERNDFVYNAGTQIGTIDDGLGSMDACTTPDDVTCA